MHTKREPDLYPAPGILPAAGKSVLPLRHLLSRGHKKNAPKRAAGERQITRLPEKERSGGHFLPFLRFL